MSIQLDTSGAASPDDIPKGEKEHPFNSLMANPQEPQQGTEADPNAAPPPMPQQSSEDDVSDFDENSALTRLFSLSPEQAGGSEVVPSSTPVQTPTQQPTAQPPAPEKGGEGEAGSAQAPTGGEQQGQIAGLNEKETELITNFRSGELQKKLTVLEKFEENPVNFVRQYAPEIEAAVVERVAAEHLAPEDFAVQYAEARLAEKYGAEFEFDPADVAIRGSQSEQFFTDKQLFLAEGARRYNEHQNQKNAEELANRQRVEQTARKVLVAQGYAPQQYDEAIRIAEGLPATPDTYYEMLFTYLNTKGLIKPAGQPPAQPRVAASQPIQSSGSDLPPSTSVPGSTSSPPISNEAKNLVDLFGVELL